MINSMGIEMTSVLLVNCLNPPSCELLCRVIGEAALMGEQTFLLSKGLSALAFVTVLVADLPVYPTGYSCWNYIFA